MPPSIIWGIGIGLIIAAIDTAAILLAGVVNPNDWPIDEIDNLANIVLYSLIGLRVGRATGLVRDAAEGGVMAGVLVALIDLAAVRAFPLPASEMDAPVQIVQHFAWNIVMGGCLAIVTGWFGSRASKSNPNARP